jgi:hypothetical protein
MKVLINFANEKFRFTQKANSLTGKLFGDFDRVIEYSPKDIDADFYEQNKAILDIKKGAGLWLWKPYFILKTLQNLNEGDILFYSDSGSLFIRSVDHLVNQMNKDNLNVFFTFTPYIAKNWTRKYTFDFLGSNSDLFYNALHPSAGFILLKKSHEAEKFITEWLNLCCNFDLIRDEYEGEDNLSEFIEHRHDQAILSILARKHQMGYYKDLSQFGSEPFYLELFEYYKLPFKTYEFIGEYPTILVLHRVNKAVRPVAKYYVKRILFKLNKRLYYKVFRKTNQK